MTAARSRLRAEDALLLGAVACLPWAFGGMEMWAYRTAAFLAVAAPAVALVRRSLTIESLRTAWTAPALALCLWALVQSVPLPPALVDLVSPEAGRARREALPLAVGGDLGVVESWAVGTLEDGIPAEPPEARTSLVAVNAPQPSAWPTLSVAPSVTMEAFFWYAALLAGASFAAARTRSPERREAYERVLLFAFGLLALFGLVQAATWNGKLFWTWDVPGRPFGPYVNGTHFGGLMELAAPWSAGYTFAILKRRGIAALGTPAGLIAASGTAICAVAGVSSQSKAAAFLIAASLSVLAFVVARGARTRVVVALGLAAAWGASWALVMRSALGDRISDFLAVNVGSFAGHERVEAWAACLPAVRDFVVAGSGFGTFRYVFPRYLPAGEASMWGQAHNDYLELLVGGGIVAGSLLLWLGWAACRAALRALRSTDRRGERTARWGLLLGVLSLCVHAAGDFNHQIPANGLAFFIAAAIATSSVSDLTGDSA